MSEEPIPLDPDEVKCPRCKSAPSVPCVTAAGAKSRTVHMERRRLAATGKREQPRAKRSTTGSRKSPGTPEGRSKGAKAANQARARRRAEAAALAEQMREEAEAEALAREAQSLAEDAVKYDKDRAVVRRQTLTAAQLAGERLVEGLTHMNRPRSFDENGMPSTRTEEVYRTVKGKRVRETDADGTPTTREVPDNVGWYTVDKLEALAKVAAATLNAVRLEEGKPTGILRNQGDTGRDPAEVLGAAGIRELAAFAVENLVDDEGGAES